MLGHQTYSDGFFLRARKNIIGRSREGGVGRHHHHKIIIIMIIIIMLAMVTIWNSFIECPLVDCKTFE